MTVFRYDSEMWAVRKTEEHLLNCFQRNYPQILFGTHLSDRISISKLRKKKVLSKSNLCRKMISLYFFSLNFKFPLF